MCVRRIQKSRSCRGEAMNGQKTQSAAQPARNLFRGLGECMALIYRAKNLMADLPNGVYTHTRAHARTRMRAMYTSSTLGINVFPLGNNKLYCAQRPEKLWAGWAA